MKLLDKNISIKPQEVRVKKQFEKVKTVESELEHFTGSKMRLPDLDTRRNNIPLSSPGDKIYKNVDYSPGFFKPGGLIVGSTNIFQYKEASGKKSDLFYASLDLNKKTLDPEKLWRSRELKEGLEYDCKYVSNLRLWEEDILKPYLPPKAGSAISPKKK